MLFKENMLHVILHCILFINFYYKTNASPMRDQFVEGRVRNVIKSEVYPEDYLDRYVYEPQYLYEDPCQDCDYLERKNKRHTADGPMVTEGMPIPRGLIGYNDLIKTLIKPKKSADVFISRGWGAGGMPFNVLYTPTTNQQKILRSMPEKVVVAPVSIYPPIGEPMALSAPQPPPPPPPPVSYSLVQEGKKEQINKKQQELQKLALKVFQKQTPTRRHYSIIPQLFVSYGWGPAGK